MRVAIMGSGNGATAAAFEWAQAGHEVSMWDFERFGENIAAISAAGHIEGRVKFEGTARSGTRATTSTPPWRAPSS